MTPFVGTGIAQLGAYPDAIEEFRFFVDNVTAILKVVVPLRVFQNDLHLGINLPRRAEHTIPCHLEHQLLTILRPAQGAFRGRALGTLAIREEEIINDNLIENPGGNRKTEASFS